MSPIANKVPFLGPSARAVFFVAAGACYALLCGCEQGAKSDRVAKSVREVNGGAQSRVPSVASQAPPGRPNGAPFAVAQGTVEYIHSGVRTGRETLQFRRYGLWQARDRALTIDVSRLPLSEGPGSAQATVHARSVLDGTAKTTWDVDLLLGKRARFEGPTFDKSRSLEPSESPAELTVAFLKEASAVSGEVRTVADVACQVWKVAAAELEVCERLGVVLEATALVLGAREHVVATRVDFQSEVAKTAFRVPGGIRFRADSRAEAVDEPVVQRPDPWAHAQVDPSDPAQLERLKKAAREVAQGESQ